MNNIIERKLPQEVYRIARPPSTGIWSGLVAHAGPAAGSAAAAGGA
jgi:hypothetical protein